jgi:uncharacterized membrane protein YfcA
LNYLFFLISLFSSTIGAISGIGGGVIIKPVLDATGTLSVSTISWLSGCTVLSMSAVSLLRGRKSGVSLEVRSSTALAIGAALGGIAGKGIFDLVRSQVGRENLLGGIQAILLLLITAGVFFYIRLKEHIVTRQVKSLAACSLIGLLLGLLSAFLGIGGGPINIAVLYYFFSMDSKKAAKNSLYIILFSQITSFCSTLIRGNVPPFDMRMLLLMIAGGVAGGILGSSISRRISAKRVETVFTLLLFIIIGVNIYNIVRFLG